MYVRNLNGDEFPAQITTTVESEINTNPILSATIQPTKANLAFLEDMSEVWHIVDDEDTVYVPIYFKKKGIGQHMQADIKAIPLFFDEMNVQRIYERYDRSFAASAYFELIFADSGYGFTLHDSFPAQSFQGVGEGATRLDEFKRGIERYGIEFEIVGATVHLKRLIGNDTQFRYEYRLNASNIVQEVDANELWTYARGYGDYGDGEGGEDWQNAKLFREYTSPLASLIGKRDAPPIKNGNITTTSTMDEQLRILVNDSLKISATADIHSLEKQGYPIAQAQLGDRSFLIDGRIDFDEEVRVVRKRETRNWKGELIGLDLTFGSPGIVRRHQSKLESARKEITDFLAGKTKLPFSSLDAAVQAATKALQSAQSELIFENGIVAVDKSDPNLVTLFNSAGLGVSTDGGATFNNAITGRGIVAEAIYGASIFGVNISSESGESTMWIEGGDIRLSDISSGRNLNLNPRGMTGFNESGDILFQANRTWVTSGIFGTNTRNVYLAAGDDANVFNGEARVVHISGIPGDGLVGSYKYLPLRADGFFGNFLEVNSGATGNNLYGRPRLGGEFRITAANTTDIYYPLRAGNIFGAAFITTTQNAYIGTDDELRVVNKGGAAVPGTDNLIYRTVRANGYIGQFLQSEVGFYSYIGTDLGLRVTSRGMAASGPTYRDVTAASFTNGSRIESKEDVQLWEADALDIIKNADITSYFLKGDIEQGRNIRKYGLVIGGQWRTPEHIINGDGVDQYAMESTTWLAMQQLLARVEKLEAEMKIAQ